MPAPEQAGRTDDAVYWEAVGTDRYGDPVWATPVPLLVKWGDTRRVQRLPTGEDVDVTAELLLDRRVTDGGLFWKGKLRDFDPDETTLELYQVVGYASETDVKGRSRVHTASLSRFRGSLPPGSGT